MPEGIIIMDKGSNGAPCSFHSNGSISVEIFKQLSQSKDWPPNWQFREIRSSSVASNFKNFPRIFLVCSYWAPRVKKIIWLIANLSAQWGFRRFWERSFDKSLYLFYFSIMEIYIYIIYWYQFYFYKLYIMLIFQNPSDSIIFCFPSVWCPRWAEQEKLAVESV